MGITNNDVVRVEAKADQATAMLRDNYANLSMVELQELSEIGEFLATQGKVGIIAAKTIFISCGIEHLRRAKNSIDQQ